MENTAQESSITTLIRKFKLEDGRVLDDPNPGYSPKEVMKFYSASMPELINAGISPSPTIEDGNAIYELSEKIGTLG